MTAALAVSREPERRGQPVRDGLRSGPQGSPIGRLSVTLAPCFICGSCPRLVRPRKCWAPCVTTPASAVFPSCRVPRRGQRVIWSWPMWPERPPTTWSVASGPSGCTGPGRCMLSRSRRGCPRTATTRTPDPGQQRRLRRVGAGHPTGLRGHRAELDLRQLHDAGDAHRDRGDRARLSDSGDRRDGPWTRVGAVAALGIALVKRRRALFWRATRALLVGFAVAITLTTAFAWCAKLLGWVTLADVTGPRPGTEFIYSPNKWSFIVALIAGAAGVFLLPPPRPGACPESSSPSPPSPPPATSPWGWRSGLAPRCGVAPCSWVSTCPGWRWPARLLRRCLQHAVWARASAKRAEFLARLRSRKDR